VKTGWELSNELDDNIAFFKQAKADVLASYCVDTKRVFVAAAARARDMAHILGCRLGNELRGIASVGRCMANTIAPAPGRRRMPAPARGQESYANICLKTVDFSSCNGNVAVIMVHGFEDPHIPWATARITRDKGGRRRTVQATTTPDIDMVHTTITAGTVIVPPPGMWNTPKVPIQDHVQRRERLREGLSGALVRAQRSGLRQQHARVAGEHTYVPTGAGKTIWDFWKSLQ
jgi:hypothetical protein